MVNARAIRDILENRLFRLTMKVAQEVLSDQVLLRAGMLTYVTLLSLIPILAIGISMLDVFGKSEGLARMIVEQVAAGSPETVDRIVEMVNNANFSGLGTFGGIVAFLTTILAIGNIEQAFNKIWGVQRQRTWVRRFSDYLTIMVAAPLLLALSLSIATTLNSETLVQQLLTNRFFERTYDVGLQYVPFISLCVAFSLLYLVLPNTRVRVKPAVFGGLVAGVLFSLAQKLYVGLSVGGAKYSALFGSVAFLPLLFVWIYICWVVVLLGAAVAYVSQNYRRIERELRDSLRGPGPREALCLEISVEVARAFRERGAAVSAERLAERLDATFDEVRRLLVVLEGAGVVAPRSGVEESFQMARPAEKVLALEVWRIGCGMVGMDLSEDGSPDGLARFLRAMRLAEEKAVGEVSLVDLLEREEAPAAVPASVDP